jgi:hypothetical protein
VLCDICVLPLIFISCHTFFFITFTFLLFIRPIVIHLPLPFSVSFTIKYFSRPNSPILLYLSHLDRLSSVLQHYFPTSLTCKAYRHSSPRILITAEDSSRFPHIHTKEATDFPQTLKGLFIIICRCFNCPFVNKNEQISHQRQFVLSFWQPVFGGSS